MDKLKTITALDALAQEKRLDIFRLLLAQNPKGLMVGEISQKLEIAPTTLAFHLDKLRYAGLIHAERDGRATIYRADLQCLTETLHFLTKTCCTAQDANCDISIKTTCQKQET